MIKQQAFIMPFENMFTHQTNILIFAHHPEAEPRGILLIKASKKNRADQVIEEVLYKKTGNDWVLESGNPDWITFETPTESASIHDNYKHAVFPHKLKINEEEEEIKLEIINA